MSYYKCKGISRRNEKITLTLADSSLYPVRYFKHELKGENQLFWLYVDIEQGNIHLNDSLYNYNYALWKTREYQKENNIDSFKDLYLKKYDYYNEKIKELTGVDITGDYWKNEEQERKYEDFKKENSDLIEKLRYESYFKVYKACYEVFKEALEEKHKGKYYLYSKTYGNINPKGTKGSFYYNIPLYRVQKMDYKKAYCLAKNISRNDIEIKEVITSD